MRALAIAVTLLLWASQAQAGDRFWVTSDLLNRRTCPSAECGIVGRMFFREGVEILERKGGWARISPSYDASCVGGKSEYVDKGNASCTESNGIRNGKFAEWVFAQHLSLTRPPDPGANTSGFEKLVSGSDDFRKHRKAFAKAAEELIKSGRCRASDFEEFGGWLKSSNHRSQPIYFAYCGGFTARNRLYLNAETGKVFR